VITINAVSSVDSVYWSLFTGCKLQCDLGHGRIPHWDYTRYWIERFVPDLNSSIDLIENKIHNGLHLPKLRR